MIMLVNDTTNILPVFQVKILMSSLTPLLFVPTSSTHQHILLALLSSKYILSVSFSTQPLCSHPGSGHCYFPSEGFTQPVLLSLRLVCSFSQSANSSPTQ